MAFVVRGGYISIGGTDRSALCESWEPNWELEIVESRPFNIDYVAKDSGLTNHKFSATFIDDSSLTLTQYFNNNAGTSVAFALRYKDSAVGATNPQWTGNAICPAAGPPATQGEAARFTVEFEVDGQATMATS